MRLAAICLTAAALACGAVGGASAQALQPPPPTGQRTATFAGGCFWSMSVPFNGLPGVTAVTVGYTGGTKQHPTYEEVSYGDTGHLEAVQVTFDPKKTSYAALLDVFWHNIDPFDPYGQFCDHGPEYGAAVFTTGPEQAAAAEASRTAVAKKLGREVATKITPAGPFWRAEDYHQDYPAKNPAAYARYRTVCHRHDRLETVWGNDAPKLLAAQH